MPEPYNDLIDLQRHRLFRHAVLRRLPAANPRLQLVRYIGFTTPASAGEFLLDGLPGLLGPPRGPEHGRD